MCETVENVSELLKEKLSIGNELLINLNSLQHICGIDKLKRKVKKEIDFLQKKQLSETIKIEHIHCTNLNHFIALYDTVTRVTSTKQIDQAFWYNNQKLYVDVVCEDGSIWIKVVARNPKSLQQIVNGDSSYGTRSILDHADCYVNCAEQNAVCYQTPKVLFHFSQGVTDELVQQLEDLSILVTTNQNLLTTLSDITKSNKRYNVIRKLNLDVSTMIAYASNLTNGHCNYIYREPLLTEQAEWERLRPVKPILDNLFQDKELFCCQTAADNFNSILETVGGETEKNRGSELLNRITILPDDFDEGTLITNLHRPTLQIGGKIKERSRLIFEFGETIQAVTITANDGFVRAAKKQGVEFTTFVHESRALTEQKQTRAKVIEND